MNGVAKLPPPIKALPTGVAQWVWKSDADLELAERIPAGIAMQHRGHTMIAVWATYAESADQTVRMDSLVPLTIIGDLVCPVCGLSGRIENGQWLPTGDVT